MKFSQTLTALCSIASVTSFTATTNHHAFSISSTFTKLNADIAEAAAEETKIEIDPKEAVKVFGRLAEKYIMLDSSGGMCCFSACSDCEYRLPGGGYKMADQSAARPKWIPAYEERKFESSGKEHTSKWSQEIFGEGKTFVTREEFIEKLSELEYAPALGGPFVAKTGADMMADVEANIAEASSIPNLLFNLLSFDEKTGEYKEKLTRHRMGMNLRDLAKEGEDFLTWPTFLASLESSKPL